MSWGGWLTSHKLLKACWRACCVQLAQVNPVDCILNMPTAFWMCGRLGSCLIWSYYTCFIWNTENKKTSSAFPSLRLQSVFACLDCLWLIYDASLIGCWDAIFCRECSPGDYQRNFETNDNFPYLPPTTCFTSLQSDQTKPYPLCPISQNSWTSCTRIARSVHLILETIECSIN